MSVINWDVPVDAKPDWLMGAGATRAERGVIWLGALTGAAFVGWQWLTGQVAEWAWWQYLVAALIWSDLVGGAVSNSCGSTKRQYFGPAKVNSSLWVRVLRSPEGFASLHVYPFVIVWLFAGGSWLWAAGIFLAMLASVIVVDLVVPQYLQRPSAMLLFCVTLLATLTIGGAPQGWQWFPVVFLAKLLLAHAVKEEPYRPGPGT